MYTSIMICEEAKHINILETRPKLFFILTILKHKCRKCCLKESQHVVRRRIACRDSTVGKFNLAVGIVYVNYGFTPAEAGVMEM